MLETLGELEIQIGKSDTLLADNGYYSQDNVKACAERGITPLIALGREAHPSTHSTATPTRLP